MTVGPEPEIASQLAGGTVADVCDSRADLTPNEEAVVDRYCRLTWRQLRERSDRVALALLELGLSRGAYAVAQLPNRVELFLVRIACEKAGIPLACIPVTFRQAEIQSVCEALRPQVAFVGVRRNGWDPVRSFRSIAGSAPHVLVHVGERGHEEEVELSAFAGEPSILEFRRLERWTPSEQFSVSVLDSTRFHLHDGSEVWTTSGSTGVPKCVEVTSFARGLTGCVQARRWGIGPRDVIAACTPLGTGSSDALAYHAAPRLAQKIVLVDHFDPDDFIALVRSEHITCATVVPTMLVRLAKYPGADGARDCGLRVLASYGAVAQEQVASAVERRTGARIVQAYGATDSGGIAANCYTDPPLVRWRSVGLPLDGNEVELRDDEGKAVPAGEIGRVYVKGSHAVSGYLQNARLTAATSSDGWCAMEDMAYRDPDGNLIVVGRRDDVIIRGGQNIFPADVEDLLTHHVQVAEAAIIGLPDDELGQRICACVVPRAGCKPDFADMVNYLRGQGLASFKLPERLVLLESLPRTANGLKVNKKILIGKVLDDLHIERR